MSPSESRSHWNHPSDNSSSSRSHDGGHDMEGCQGRQRGHRVRGRLQPSQGERHLDGCTFENTFRPHLFITDSFVTDYTRVKRVSKDEQFASRISKTLRKE